MFPLYLKKKPKQKEFQLVQIQSSSSDNFSIYALRTDTQDWMLYCLWTAHKLYKIQWLQYYFIIIFHFLLVLRRYKFCYL